MHASTVAFALFAASQVLAAPTPASNTNTENNARSISAIGDAISGFAEDVLGPHIGKREVDERSLTAIGNFISGIFNKRDGPLDARSIDAIANAIGGFAEDVLGPHFGKREVDERSLTAISNFIHNLKRSEEFDERSLSAIEGVVHDIFGKRSLKAVGAAVAGGVASGVAGAAASSLFGRSESSGLMVDTETGTIYMDIPDSTEPRSLKAVGAAVAGGVASGVAGAAASSLFGRSDASGLMVDTETGVLYMDIPDENGARSLKAVGAAVAGGVASGVAGAAASSLFGRSESGLMVDTDTGVLYMDIPDENGARSLKAVGAAVAGGVASGVAGAAASSLFGRSDSGLMVDTETGVLYMDVPNANEARSLKAVGAAVAGGVASGVAGAAASSLFGRSESGLMVDTETGVLYMDVPDANEGRSLKAVGAAVAGGVASGVAGAAASSLFGRSESSGLMVDTDTGVLYMDIPDANEGRSLKAVGTAIAGGVASLATGAIANEVLGNDKRSLSAIEDFIGGIFDKRDEPLDARSFTAIGNFISGIFNKREELDERSLTAIGNFISGIFNKRDEPLDARSLTAIGNFISGIFNKRDGGSAAAINHQIKQILQRSELAASMAARSIDDLE